MFSWFIPVSPDVPIMDPQRFTMGPGATVFLFLAMSWLWGVALYHLVGGKSVNDIRHIMNTWLMRFAVFVGLASVPIYYYPPFDGWWFKHFSPYYTGLTVYSLERFGVVHIPTVILFLFIVLAVFLTPRLANWIDVVAEWAVQRATRPAEVEI